ncbi:GntR family transcriptional regulator [Spirochaetia bacterium 38H-sp]|uniref:GntR family transcriptional regulator n=1 Tax=Rarispira pelagica TaxID=3141764 RepID=A0ABU9UC21_9SPIR
MQEKIPKYKKVKQEIIKLIKQKGLTPGDSIPTEAELSELFAVSRNTVRLAVDELVYAELLERRQGSGTYIVEKKTQDNESGRLIGVVHHSITDNIYPHVIRGIDESLHNQGYSMVLSTSNRDKKREIINIKRLLKERIKGLILEPYASASISASDELVKIITDASIPVVLIHCELPFLSLSSVNIDDWKTGYQAASYLIERGHKHIGCIYKKNTQAGTERFKGFLQAIKDNGLKENPDYYASFLEKDEHGNPGASLALQMASLSSPPTAIFFYNDETAIKGIMALIKKGIRIPEDISVIGHDDLPQSAITNPPLTTFSHPKDILGRWAADLVIQEINDPFSIPKAIRARSTLIERKSVKNMGQS